MAKEYKEDTGDMSRSCQLSRYAEYVANLSPMIFCLNIALIIAYCINYLLQHAVDKAFVRLGLQYRIRQEYNGTCQGAGGRCQDMQSM